MPILQGWKGRYCLFIPKAVVTALAWRKGDEVIIEILPDRTLRLRNTKVEENPLGTR